MVIEEVRMERGRGKRKDVCGLGGKERILIEMARQEWEGRGVNIPVQQYWPVPFLRDTRDTWERMGE